MPADPVVIASDEAKVVVDLEHGGRLASLQILGHELLVTQGAMSIQWGCFVMAPWAGRVRNGRFGFAGRQYQLPLNFGEHAIHGTVFDRAWTAVGETVFSCPLESPWPFSGEVRHEVHLRPGALDMTLEVRSIGGPMPASCGWHPFFRRRIAGSELALSFDASFMLLRDEDGIPIGHSVPPPPGPWDDCFGGLKGPVVLEWPGVLLLTMTSSCEYLVIYDELDQAIGVEPQSAPPNALNGQVDEVTQGRPLIATTTLSWEQR
jgi:aldose 1-epimerase